MTEKLFLHRVKAAYNEKRRLVAPLMGFPGLNLTGSTIKLAQQNYGEHFKAIKALADLFHPDAVFPLMDLSVEANALGRYTVFPKEESATVVRDHFSLDDLKRFREPVIGFDTRLSGYVETVKLMSIVLPQSIIRGAYVTGPYTLAALLMGADDAAMASILDPDELEQVCQFATERVLEYTRLLVSAGAQMICVLEPSAVMLGPEQFARFSGHYVHSITLSCEYTDVAVVYHTCGNTMHLIEKMAECSVNALSLDADETGVDLAEAAKRVPEDVIIIGNISPVGTLLHGTPAGVEKEVLALLDRMRPFANFVLSSGCDLPQETPIENIKAFMRCSRDYRLP